MAEILQLPPEIVAFLRTPAPQSLLIRGPPGTGKTMMAVELLRSFGGHGVYVSCRVRGPQLRASFPWLDGGRDAPIRAVDAAESPVDLRNASEMLDAARTLVAERESNESLRALWLPEPILDEWSRITPERPTMMVIDSWDALVERYLGPRPPSYEPIPDRTEIERILLDLVARAPVFLVLVTETPDRSQLDYLVNGAVSMRWERVGSRKERWLSLEKLRGVRIDIPEYPFTLDGGRFACISPAPPAYRPDPGHFADTGPSAPGRLHPGSPDFLAAFGDLPLPGVSLFELEGPVPYDAVRVILGPMQTRVVHDEGRVVHFLAPGVIPASIVNLYRSVFPRERVERSVRIATGTTPLSEEVRRLVLPLPAPDLKPNQTRFRTAWEFLQETPPGAPRLAISWISGLKALAHAAGFDYDPMMFPALTANILEESAVHMLYIGESTDEITRRLAPISASHVRFVQRHDRTFLEGVNPQTPGFVLAEGNDSMPYRLVRVV